MKKYQYKRLLQLIFLYKIAYHNTKKVLHTNQQNKVWENYKKYDKIENELISFMNSLVVE